jgi:hypothetical protein
MLSQIHKKIPITTIIVAYFFLSGCLYLFGFWGTFDIDIFNFVALMDIAKSFVYPLFGGALSMLIFVVASLFNARHTSTEINEDEARKESRLWLGRILVIVFMLSLSLYYFLARNSVYWFISSFAYAAVMSRGLQNRVFIKSLLPLTEQVRYIVLYAFFFIPFYCFAVGKTSSLDIYNNRSVRDVVFYTSSGKDADSTDLKFVGFIGDKVIVSSVNNKNVMILNQSAYNKIVLGEKVRILSIKKSTTKYNPAKGSFDTTIITDEKY